MRGAMMDRRDIARQESMRWTPTDLPKYITLSKFCQLDDVSETAAQEWISDGKLPHVKFGKTIRIPLTALNGF
jgi:excisionase family DNA binding protein